MHNILSYSLYNSAYGVHTFVYTVHMESTLFCIVHIECPLGCTVHMKCTLELHEHAYSLYIVRECIVCTNYGSAVVTFDILIISVPNIWVTWMCIFPVLYVYHTTPTPMLVHGVMLHTDLWGKRGGCIHIQTGLSINIARSGADFSFADCMYFLAKCFSLNPLNNCWARWKSFLQRNHSTQ